VWGAIKRYVDEHFDFESYDFSAEAGGVKNMLVEAEREQGVKGILISCRLHCMHTVVLTAHEDCGAYGGSSTFGGDYDKERAFHIEEMKKARDIIERSIKDKKNGCLDENGEYVPMDYVFLWAHFSDDGSRVEIERIDA
jgi:hypothetical protein